MKPNEWIIHGEVGISSKTIWAVMMDLIKEPTMCSMSNSYDIPQDPSDFRRCLILLEYIPEWKERLYEVGELLPKWKPMIDNWYKMEKLYNEELPTGKAPKLYALMRELVEQGLLLDGWTKKGNFGWERNNLSSNEIVG